MMLRPNSVLRVKLEFNNYNFPKSRQYQISEL